MKQKITLFVFAGLISLVLSSYRSGAAYNIGRDGTGAEGSSGGCGGGCHGSTTVNGVTVELDSAGIPVTSYRAGMSYTVKITATNATGSTLPKFGFQLAIAQESGAGTSAAVQGGTWGTTMASSVQLTTAATSGLSLDIVEQNRPISPTSGTGANGTIYTDTATWIAPASGSGSVIIYGVLNAVNNNGNADNGDKYQQAIPDTISEAASCPTVTVSISQSGHTLTAQATGVSSYQWYLNGTAISGATSSTYTATTSGSYTVVATTSGGCSGTSTAYNYTTGINQLTLSDVIQVYPTVTESNVNVKINYATGALNYAIYGLDGRKYEAGNIAAGSSNTMINLSQLSSGIYIIQIGEQSQSASYKIVKQ